MGANSKRLLFTEASGDKVELTQEDVRCNWYCSRSHHLQLLGWSRLESLQASWRSTYLG